MGYNPKAEWTIVSSPIPQVTCQLEQIREARDQACLAMCKVQLGWIKDSKRKQHMYQVGDQVWLDGRNIKMYQPTAKLAAKRHGPFPIQRVLSPIDYQLTLPEQWRIHDVFHVNLLTPYREMEFHGPNYARLPPDLMGEEEQYEVEQVLDERNYGHRKKKQYLVKWKGYPDSDNQWLDAKDMDNAQELIAEFHDSRSNLSSHIKRTLERISSRYPSFTLPSTLISTHMSNASTLAELPFRAEENTDPLPIPPHTATPDASSPQLHVQNPTPTSFVHIQDNNFPHPDKPTPSELNDSDQENIQPPIPEVPHRRPTVRAPLGRTQAAIPLSDDSTTNQAILAAITQVRNTVHHGDTYVSQIEEIIRIARALRHRGMPSEDDKAAALIAQLHQIRRLESGSESTASEAHAPTDITIPTPPIQRNSQVTASTTASHAQVRTVASGPPLPQQHHTRGARGAGSQVHHMGGGVQPVLTGVRVGAELLSPRLARRAETLPPLGFNFNRGVMN